MLWRFLMGLVFFEAGVSGHSAESCRVDLRQTCGTIRSETSGFGAISVVGLITVSPYWYIRGVTHTAVSGFQAGVAAPQPQGTGR